MSVDRTGVQRRFLWMLKNSLNRLTTRIARSGRGPFSLVRHVGRTSGRTYETPVILARVPQGFVAELTYGAGVDWYRNIVAAGGCVVVSGGAEYRIDRIEPCDPATGLRAFGHPAGLFLRLLHRREFRLLHVGSPGVGPPSPARTRLPDRYRARARTACGALRKRFYSVPHFPQCRGQMAAGTSR